MAVHRLNREQGTSVLRQRGKVPILVAAFASAGELHEAFVRLEALQVGRDLIGVCTGVNVRNGHGEEEVHLLSVLPPSRLRAAVEGLLLQCNALSVGSAADMRAAFGVIPHPGVLEDREMKLPMGSDYGNSRIQTVRRDGVRP